MTKRETAIENLSLRWKTFDFVQIATWRGGAYQLVRPGSVKGSEQLAAPEIAPCIGYFADMDEAVIERLQANGLVFILSIGSAFPLLSITIPDPPEGIHTRRLQYLQDMTDRSILMSAWQVLGLPEEHLDSPFWEGEEDRNSRHLEHAGAPDENPIAEIYRLLGSQPPWTMPQPEFQAWLEQAMGVP